MTWRSTPGPFESLFKQVMGEFLCHLVSIQKYSSSFENTNIWHNLIWALWKPIIVQIVPNYIYIFMETLIPANSFALKMTLLDCSKFTFSKISWCLSYFVTKRLTDILKGFEVHDSRIEKFERELYFVQKSSIILLTHTFDNITLTAFQWTNSYESKKFMILLKLMAAVKSEWASFNWP